MDELGNLKELVLQYARGVWKNRWIAIAIAWVVLILGVIAVDQLKNKYEAETKVYIDSTSVLKPLLRGIAIESDFESVVALMVRQLLSRPNLERAIRTMDMDLNIDTPAEMEKLIGAIRKRTNISAQKRSGIYTITYIDTDRTRSRQMVQTLLDIFVEDSLGKSGNESDLAIEFLDQQIARYDGLLREAEERVETFKRDNLGLMPKDSGNYYSQLQAVELQIEQGDLMMSELVNRRERIKKQIEDFKENEVVQEVVIRTSLDERIEKQEKGLDELLLLYTDQHPDVINAQQVLEGLRERKSLEVKQIVPGALIGDNPVYQELQISLSKVQADISSVKARIESLNKKRAELQRLVDIAPRIEGELVRLNRDYEVHRRNYTELVQRREQARISEDVQTGSDQVKFRVIEPPYVPLRPTFPNRPLFDMGVIILAIVIGYGISLLISQFQPVFYNQRDLMNRIGGSILGAVSKFDTPEVLSKRRQNMILFGFANFLLLCAGGFLIYLHSQGVLIMSRLQTMVM